MDIKDIVLNIKEEIKIDDIFLILDSIELPLYKDNSNYYQPHCIYYSVCHHPEDYMHHKPKLYFYHETKSFYCYSCSQSFDIFGIVCNILNIKFVESVNYIIKILNLQFDVQAIEEKKKRVDNWKSVKKYLPNNSTYELNIYDKNILKLFTSEYHSIFTDDNISIETLKKFNIKWYELKQQIAIPIFDEDGNLVGIQARNTIPELIDAGLKYCPLRTLNTEYKFPTSKVSYGLNVNKYNIEHTKEVILCEGVKGVLQLEEILDVNNSIAIFGTNFDKVRRNQLLKLGVENVVICLDKEYDNIKNEIEVMDYKTKVDKIANIFKGMCDVYYVYDKHNLLNKKNSPMDLGKDVWNELYLNKEKIN